MGLGMGWGSRAGARWGSGAHEATVALPSLHILGAPRPRPAFLRVVRVQHKQRARARAPRLDGPQDGIDAVVLEVALPLFVRVPPPPPPTPPTPPNPPCAENVFPPTPLPFLRADMSLPCP